MEEILPQSKKQKLDGGILARDHDKMDNDFNIFQCGYFLKKKNRYCKMHRKRDAKYCPEHNTLSLQNYTDPEVCSSERKRINCPVDPSHTIWEDNLKRHLKKCNKVKLTELPKKEIYYKENINCSDINSENLEPLNFTKTYEFVSLIDERYEDFTELTRREFYDYWIPVIEKTYQNLMEFLNERHLDPSKTSNIAETKVPLEIKNVSQDTAIAERLDELTNHKHIAQQSSLIGHLKDTSLYGGQFNYIEYGCGRAELSRYLCKDIVYGSFEAKTNCDSDIAKSDFKDKIPSFLLIDRSSARLKMDSKIGKDFEECSKKFRLDINELLQPQIQRIKIDIKDLFLDKVLDGNEKKHVAISKHLCGCATDLTLQSLLNSQITKNGRFAGLLVAMCCRHVCNYDYLLSDSKRFLDLITGNFGKNKVECLAKIKEFFKILTKIVSWSTCGRREGMSPDSINNHPSNLTILQREEIGLKVKRIIDEARVFGINNTGFLQSRIFQYVNRETSLENIALIVTPKVKK